VRDLVVVGWSHAGQHAYIAGLGILVPFVVAAEHLSYAGLGVLLAVASALGSGLQLLAGVLRRASLRLLLTGQNLGATVGALVAAVGGFGGFAAGRLVQAVTGWPQHPAGSAYLARRHPNRRGSVLSWHVTAGNVGTLVAPLVISAVAASAGWRWAFVVLGGVLASTVVAVALWLPVGWRADDGGEGRVSAAEPSVRAAWRETRDLLRSRAVLAILLAGTIAAGGQGIGVLGVYAPAYLHSGLHLPALTVGAVLTVVYLGAVAGPVLMGEVGDRIGHRASLLANYLLGAAALVGFAVVGAGPVALAGVGLAVGVFSYSELSLRMTLFADHMPDEAARSGFGVFFTVSQTVGSVWVAVIGVLVSDVGFKAAFGAMAATFLVAGALVALGTAGGAPGAPAVRAGTAP
jgi:MFS family permease